MKILITGATGFIGSAVTRRALAEGHAVRALTRPGSDTRNLEGLPVERATGDLTRPDTLRPVLEGCDAVIHTAGDYRLWSRDRKEVYRINVEGTRNLLHAAVDTRIRRVIHTSSVATLGLAADGGIADETTPVGLEDMVGDYKRSKYLAEELARSLGAEQGLSVSVVNPAAPVGPRDIRPTPTGRLVLDAAAGRMPAYVHTGLNIVHVDDVAAGHLLALARGEPGRCYILGAENMTLREILAEVAAQTGGRAPRLRLAPGVVLPIAYAAEAWASVTGREPRVTVDGVRLSRKRMFFSSERARAELGYTPRPAKEALADAVAWFRSNGYLAVGSRNNARPAA